MPSKITISAVRPRTEVSPRVVLCKEKMFFGTDSSTDAKAAAVRQIERAIKMKLVSLSRDMNDAIAIRDAPFDNEFLKRWDVTLEIESKPMTMAEFAIMFEQPYLL